jgi:putative (di)nucleoside polyphosphate hydrolase
MSRNPTALKLPYRPCAGMVVLNSEGKVFAGKRIDRSVEAWQMPQGGIEANEEPRAAALRELEEEIGTKNVEILREHPEWLAYDLPENLIGLKWKGRYRGQTQKWFAMRFLGSDHEINLETSHPEFSEWRWLGATELLAKIVTFKRPIYKKIYAAFDDLMGVSQKQKDRG